MRKILLSVVSVSLLNVCPLLASHQEELDFQAAIQLSLKAEEDRVARVNQQAALAAERQARRISADAKEMAEIMRQIELSERMQPSSHPVEMKDDFAEASRLSKLSFEREKAEREKVIAARTTTLPKDPNELQKHLKNFDATRNALNLKTPAYRQPATKKQEQSDLLAALGRSLETEKKENNNGQRIVEGNFKDKLKFFNQQ